VIPWSVDEEEACFIVRDANRQALAYVYCEEEPGRRSAAHLLTRDEARRIAANIANPEAPETTSGHLWPGAGPSAANDYPLSWQAVRRGNPMDQRIEAFLGDVLALAGEEPDAVRDGVRVALAKCEARFPGAGA
jgi:hypothetical protein